MKKFLLFLEILAISLTASAVPAIQTPIRVIQPDGTAITIRLHGDEWYHWATTDDGYNIVLNSADGFYYYDTPRVSTRARDIAQRGTTERAMLSSVRRGADIGALQVALTERTRVLSSISEKAAEAHQKARSRAEASGEKFHSLIILVNFSDKEFVTANANTAFSNMLNQDGYSANGGTGSAWNYYYDNSNGRFDGSFDVVGPVTISRGWQLAASGSTADTRYGNMTEFVQQACQAAKAMGVNFADYADDGVVRDIFFYYAGHNQAEGAARTIWPHRSGISSYMIDGVYVSGYACSSELKGSSGSTMCGIGTFCHEFGHVLGWPDFYDIDGSQNGTAETLSSYSLMTAGNYNNGGNTPPSLTAIERWMQGWLNPTELVNTGNYTLNHISNDEAYRINTSTPDDYFLLEQRSSANKWDAGMGTFNGILVSHIDRSTVYRSDLGGHSAKDLWNSWNINIYGAHPCAFPLKASATSETQWVYNSTRPTLSDATNTKFKAWSGTSTNIALSSIASSGTTASFTLNFQSASVAVSGKVVDVAGTPLTGATVIVAKHAASPSPTMTAGLQRRNIRRAATNIGDEWFVATDNQGNFSISGLPIDTYEITVSKSGYLPNEQTVALSPSGMTLNITLEKMGNAQNRYSWHTDPVSSVGFSNLSAIVVGTKFTYADLNISGTAELRGMDFALSGSGTVIAAAYKNNTLVIQKPLGTVTPGQAVYVDFSPYHITASATDEIIVAYQVSDYSVYPVSVSGNVVDGKSNLYRSSLTSGSWSAFSGSWIIGGYFGSTAIPTGLTFSDAPTSMYVGDMKHINYSFQPTGVTAPITWSYGTADIVEMVNDGYLRALKSGSTSVMAGIDTNPSLSQFTTTVSAEITGDINCVLDSGETQVTITWTPAVSRSKWNVRWKNQYDQQWSTKTVTSPTTVLTGIIGNSNYDVQVAGERLDGEFWGYKAAVFSTTTDLPSADHINISHTEATVYVSANYQLTAEVVPSNAYNTALEWISSNEAVATVDQTGLVSGVSTGSAMITVKTKYGSDVQATCAVTVTEPLKDIVVESILQNDALFSWEGSSHTGDFAIAVYKGNTTTGEAIFSATVSAQRVYIPMLKKASQYTIVVSVIENGASGITKSRLFNTIENSSNFVAMGGGIVGNYAVGTIVPLRVVNLPDNVQSVVWKIGGFTGDISVDGWVITPPQYITTDTGKYRLECTVTTSTSEEKIVKIIKVE